MFKDKTVVVTGGTGFIGTNLVKSLAAQGARVIIVARPGSYIELSGVTLEYAPCNLQETTLFSVLKYADIKPDYIFHLAAMTGGIHYLKQRQAECLQKNLAITANSFYRLEEIHSLRGQLFLSSVCAYPQDYQTTTDLNKIVLSENLANQYNPDSAYGWAKIMGEMLIQHYAEECSVPGVSIRLFNTYGPHEHLEEHKTHVIPSLIVKAINHPEDFTLLGDGSQVRSFLYIDDAIKALEKAITRVYDGSVINIGSDVPHTINDIAKKIIEISGQDIHIDSTPNAVGAKGRIPDISKAQKMLLWAPTTSLEEGLSRTYVWIKKELARERI